MVEDQKKNNSYWKNKLTLEQYRILREKNTEKPFSGKYLDNKERGIYYCSACGSKLFSSKTKFDSGTGWPSFTDPEDKKFVELVEDFSHGMMRVEVLCKKCGGHLGHVFPDGPEGKKRYCINSACLNFKKSKAQVL